MIKKTKTKAETYYGKPCRKCGHTERLVKTKGCAFCQRRRIERYGALAKAFVLWFYEPVCFCCGCDDSAFLDLHHMNHDGQREKAKSGSNGRRFSGSSMYNRLYALYKREGAAGMPKDLQWVCSNCQAAIHRSKDGVCPHQSVMARASRWIKSKAFRSYLQSYQGIWYNSSAWKDRGTTSVTT